MEASYSEFIKKLRSDSNLTYVAFGNLFNASGQTVSSWETGKTQPSAYQLTLMLELRKKIDNLKNQSNSNIDIGKIILAFAGGVGIVAFFKWLFAED